MKTALILDCETDGLDPATCACIEIGCILFDVANAVPITSFATLIRAESNAAERINRIPTAALLSAPSPDLVWPGVRALADQADAILAHNAAFDRGFVPADLRDSKPWICTKDDLDWPLASRPNSTLIALALDHGLGVANAHRALADCDLISRLLTRIAETQPLDPFLARGLRPKALFQALVSFADRELAKAAGFSWEADRKRWVRRIAIEDVAALPFRAQQVNS